MLCEKLAGLRITQVEAVVVDYRRLLSEPFRPALLTDRVVNSVTQLAWQWGVSELFSWLSAACTSHVGHSRQNLTLRATRRDTSFGSVMRDHEMTVGLCATCAYTQVVSSKSGSVFWFCSRSREDAQYSKYPVLPVLECPGHERSPGTERRVAETPRYPKGLG